MGVAIPDADPADPALVTLPVTLNPGCNCTAANVAIAIGITHPNVGDLIMTLKEPDVEFVFLVSQPPSDANLTASNLITFDDSASGALNPQTLGNGLGTDDPIPEGTYFAQGNNTGAVDPVFGLGLFNGTAAAGDWTFEVFDLVANNTGTVESVELTITCAE